MSVFNFDNSNIHLVYEKSRLLPDETILTWLKAIQNNIAENSIQTIIDLGCGTGRFSKALSDFFKAEVIGIDPSEKMLSVAISNMGSGKIKFIQGYAESILLDTNTADLIFISHVYHHIQNKNKALKEIKRVLKRNKFLCIRQATLEELGSYIYPDFFPTAKKIDSSRLPSKGELINTVTRNGFILIKHESIRQLFAENLNEYYNKISLRGTSDLSAINNKEFYSGLKELKKFCSKDPQRPVYENVGFFLFKENSVKAIKPKELV